MTTYDEITMTGIKTCTGSQLRVVPLLNGKFSIQYRYRCNSENGWGWREANVACDTTLVELRELLEAAMSALESNKQREQHERCERRDAVAPYGDDIWHYDTQFTWRAKMKDSEAVLLRVDMSDFHEDKKWQKIEWCHAPLEVVEGLIRQALLRKQGDCLHAVTPLQKGEYPDGDALWRLRVIEGKVKPQRRGPNGFAGWYNMDWANVPAHIIQAIVDSWCTKPVNEEEMTKNRVIATFTVHGEDFRIVACEEPESGPIGYVVEKKSRDAMGEVCWLPGNKNHCDDYFRIVDALYAGTFHANV